MKTVYGVAKIIGQIFANPPFHILKCYVAFEDKSIPFVIKGKIVGTTSRGSIITFKGEVKKDKQKRDVLDIKRTPVNPMYLKGNALECYNDWVNDEDQKRLELLSIISDSGASVEVLNSLWAIVKNDPKQIIDNPYLLVDKGLTFNSVDKIAQILWKDKFDPLSEKRISASCLWSVFQGIKNGHTFLDTNTVFRDVAYCTGVDNPKDIATSLKSMRDQNRLVLDKDGNKNIIYHPSYYKMEKEVSEFLLVEKTNKNKKEYSDEYIKSFSRFDLTSEQINAIRMCLVGSVTVVTGLPGTGKTTILSTLCKILQTEKESILLVAPTGIACKRASTLTGLEAYTIHRAFGAGIPTDEDKQKSDYEGIKKDDGEDQPSKVNTSDPTSEIWTYHPNNTRDESVVIIDEASMVDLHLLWRLLRGVNLETTKIIMVGDVEQLPPVATGFTLKDIINSNAIPKIHLDKVFRQGEGSDVVNASHAIHKGVFPLCKGDFNLVECSSDHAILNHIMSITKELKFDQVDFHVISPTHHGEVGVTNLNRVLRTVLNPNINLKSIRVGNDEIRIGDKVMITQNDYDLQVFNGDLGHVHAIYNKSISIMIKGVNNQLIEIPISAVSSLLRMAYATTVHKSQGQEYDVIVMPLSKNHNSRLLKRSLVYTAITRAKKKVFLVGEKGVLIKSINNNLNDDKHSLLEKRLRS